MCLYTTDIAKLIPISDESAVLVSVSAVSLLHTIVSAASRPGGSSVRPQSADAALSPTGPGETGEPANVPESRRPGHGLVVVIRKAGDDVIDQLAKELGQRVTLLGMFSEWRWHGQVIGMSG